jgi:NAD+ diphosphatase
MSISPHRNVFAGAYLDRGSERRKDAAWVSRALAASDTRYVPVWRTMNLIRREPEPCATLLSRESLPPFDDQQAIFLGEFAGAATFAVGLHVDEPALPASFGEFTDLRFTGTLLPWNEAGLLAYARAMLWWRDRHRFCGACGAPTEATSAGHVMTCTRADCQTNVFPRVDPAIIVLVTDGERALLGRQASWPPGRYSTIAGFMEPGESFEDAVIREVREETGVEVVDLAYHSSQPWPFPSSLMIGFIAEAAAVEPSCPDGELEDARWFSPAEIASGTPVLPPVTSISFSLIAHWYQRQSGRRLIDEPGAAVWTMRR